MRNLLAVAVVLLLGTACATDDPTPAPQVFGQADAAETTAPASTDTISSTEPGDTGTDDVFPPVNPRVTRPDDDEFVDLTGSESVEIEIADNVFRTRYFIVDPGTEIVFTNVGANPHNVVPAAEGAFERIPDTALSAGPVTLVLDTPGDYPFYCSIHGGATFGQNGYVVVAGA